MRQNRIWLALTSTSERRTRFPSRLTDRGGGEGLAELDRPLAPKKPQVSSCWRPRLRTVESPCRVLSRGPPNKHCSCRPASSLKVMGDLFYGWARRIRAPQFRD